MAYGEDRAARMEVELMYLLYHDMCNYCKFSFTHFMYTFSQYSCVFDILMFIVLISMYIYILHLVGCGWGTQRL